MKIKYKRPFLYEYQRQILDSEKRYTVTEASTKVGKTASHIIWLFEQSLRDDLKPGCNLWWIAPVFGQSEIAYNRLKNQITDKSYFKTNESKLKLIAPNGVVIQFKSADNPDSLYGDDVYAAVFDEFTRAKEEAWFALRSTLTATNGKCKFIGNVKGKGNWGFKLAQKAKFGEPDFDYFKITAYDAAREGLLSLDEIESAKRELPDYVFKELYMAEPADNASNPFGYNYIKQCVGMMSNNPVEFYGIDLAKSVDWTVIIGMDKEGNVCYYERFQKDWKHTKELILSIDRSKPVLIDSTGVGDAIVEDLQKSFQRMIGFKYNSTSKQQLMELLASSIHKGEIKYPDGSIVGELEIFEYIFTATGVKYGAPSGFHDDCVNALALANKCRIEHSNYGKYYFI